MLKLSLRSGSSLDLVRVSVLAGAKVTARARDHRRARGDAVVSARSLRGAAGGIRLRRAVPGTVIIPGWRAVVWTAPSVVAVVAPGSVVALFHHLAVTAVITVLVERVRPRHGRHRALLVVLSHVTQIGGEVSRVVPHRRAAAAPAPRVITRRLSLFPGFPLRNLPLFPLLSLSLLANLLLQRRLVLGFFTGDSRALLPGEFVGSAAPRGWHAAHAGQPYATVVVRYAVSPWGRIGGRAVVVTAVVVRNRLMRMRRVVGIQLRPGLSLLGVMRLVGLSLLAVGAEAHVPLSGPAAVIVPAVAHVVDGVPEGLRVLLGLAIARLLLALHALALGDLRLELRGVLALALLLSHATLLIGVDAVHVLHAAALASGHDLLVAKDHAGRFLEAPAAVIAAAVVVHGRAAARPVVEPTVGDVIVDVAHRGPAVGALILPREVLVVISLALRGELVTNGRHGLVAGSPPAAVDRGVLGMPGVHGRDGMDVAAAAALSV